MGDKEVVTALGPNRLSWSGEGSPIYKTRPRIQETPDTCPYWQYRLVAGQVVGFVWGCGGYGEVTPDHPAARYPDGQMWQFTSDPKEGVLCSRCRGTGMLYGRRDLQRGAEKEAVHREDPEEESGSSGRTGPSSDEEEGEEVSLV